MHAPYPQPPAAPAAPAQHIARTRTPAGDPPARPSVRTWAAAALFLLLPVQASACARELLSALSTGQTAYVVSRFVAANRQASADESARLETSLGQAFLALGELRSVTQASSTPLSKFRRLTLAYPGLPAQFGSAVTAFDVVTSRVGPARVQFHMGLSGGCQVLALHIDSEAAQAAALFEPQAPGASAANPGTRP